MKTHETKLGEIAPKKKELVYNQFIRKGVDDKGEKYMNKEQIEIYEKNYNKFHSNIIRTLEMEKSSR